MGLFEILSGRAAQSVHFDGRDVAVVRCTCGRRLGRIGASRSGHFVFVVGGVRFPPGQAAVAVIDAALDDAEAAVPAGDAETTGALDEFFRALEAVDGARPGENSAGMERLSRLVPPLTTPESGPWRIPDPAPAGRLAHLTATCPKCRTSYYLGDQFLEWREQRPLPGVVVAQTIDQWRRRMSFDWPPEALPRRVALYRHLTTVLASEVQHR